MTTPDPPVAPDPPAALPVTAPLPPRVSALRMFAEARIGGEPIPSTATSELMLRTATKALGAGATLIDSVATPVAAAKPITKILRGAGVAVYTLSDTLGGKGLKRGFGLAVLALGASLVAISLISGTAPAWMATLGFGILLGGLAYAALASGMLILALVLATPVVPLIAFSMTRPEMDGDSGPERMIQIGLLVLLILTAMVMGTVTVPERSPLRWLSSIPWKRVLLVSAGVLIGLAVVGWVAWLLIAMVLDVSRPTDIRVTWGWVLVGGLMLLGLCLVVTARTLQHVRDLSQGPAMASSDRAAEQAAGWTRETAQQAVLAAATPPGSGGTTPAVGEALLGVRSSADTARRTAAAAAQAALASRTAARGAQALASAAHGRAREVAEILSTSTDPRSAHATKQARAAARQVGSWLGVPVLDPVRLAHVAEGTRRAATIAEQHALSLGIGGQADAIRAAARSAQLAGAGVATAAGRLQSAQLLAASSAGDAARSAARVAEALGELAETPGGAFATPHARAAAGHATRASSAAASVAPEGVAGRQRRAAVAAWAWVFGAVYLVVTVIGAGVAWWLYRDGDSLGDPAVHVVLVMVVTFGALSLLCQAAALSVHPPTPDELPRR